MTEKLKLTSSQHGSAGGVRSEGETWKSYWDPPNDEYHRAGHQRWPGLTPGGSAPVHKTALPTKEPPGGFGYHDDNLRASCEPAWTTGLFDDHRHYLNVQPNAVSPEPIIDGLNQLSGWPDDAIFGIPAASELPGPSTQSLGPQELCIKVGGDPSIQLLEVDVSCSPESGGLEYGGGQGFFSEMSPCTAYSNSPVSFIPTGRASAGDGGQPTYGAKRGNWGDSWWNVDAIQDEGHDQHGLNHGTFLATESSWLDDVFHQSPEPSYPGNDFLTPTYLQPSGAFSPLPGSKGPETSTWDNASHHPESYLYLQGPELPLINQASPFQAESWSSAEDLNMSQAMIPMVSANQRRLEEEHHQRLENRPAGSIVSGPSRPTLQRHIATKTNMQYHLPTSERVIAPRTWLRGDSFPGPSIHHRPQPHPRVGPRQDDKNSFLVRSKLAGMSYKEIRDQGGFTEAESTLRGRFRTLTKDKERRVRKPEWEDRDIRLLREAVESVKPDARPASSTGPSSRMSTRYNNGEPKVPWKLVAEYIAKNGGSYHFGNATCRKKWDEIKER
ncbi:MAG: hypothetical protein M1823_002029 [Watsoniomyces obsoletus]|nr:MAG: hypothetical protein M1823_002029 [Watsoniomyces obsoletus]